MNQHQIDAFEEFVAQFRAETDRAAVILGAAKLDYLMFQIVDRVLVPNYSKQDDLFDGDAPLASFSSRISLAFRLGKIDASFAKALHLIRKTRNEFAHKVPDSRLKDAPHRDRITELVTLIGDKPALTSIREAYFDEKQGAAADFFASVALLVARLETIFSTCGTVDGSRAASILPKRKPILKNTNNMKSKKKKKS